MIELIIGILIGAVGVSVLWFFVWRNNKQKFIEALEELNVTANSIQERSQLAEKFRSKISELLDGFGSKKK